VSVQKLYSVVSILFVVPPITVSIYIEKIYSPPLKTQYSPDS